MQRSKVIAIAAMTAALAAYVAPAMADGRWHRDKYWQPRPYAKNLYRNGGVRYYRNACTYGDCACLRNIALATGNPVWWDKYQACTG